MSLHYLTAVYFFLILNASLTKSTKTYTVWHHQEQKIWLKAINMQCTQRAAKKSMQYFVKNHIYSVKRDPHFKGTLKFHFIQIVSLCTSPPPLIPSPSLHSCDTADTKNAKFLSLFFAVITSLFRFLSCIAFIIVCWYFMARTT